MKLDSWWLSFTIDVHYRHGRWGQGHSENISGWALVCVFWRLQQAKGEQRPPTTPQSPFPPSTAARDRIRWVEALGSLRAQPLGSHHVTWAVSVMLTRWGVEPSASGFFTVTAFAFGAEG